MRMTTLSITGEDLDFRDLAKSAAREVTPKLSDEALARIKASRKGTEVATTQLLRRAR